MVADLEQRRRIALARAAEKAGHVADRLQPGAAGDGKRQHRRRVVVHHRHHVGPGLVDLAVDVPLQVQMRWVGGHRLAGLDLEVEQVGRRDPPRRQVARQHEAAAIAIMPSADMAEGIEDPLVGQDPVGVDQVLDQGGAGVG